MDSEDGQLFVKNLAHFVRTHEKALANALQLRRQQSPKHASSQASLGSTVLPNQLGSSAINQSVNTATSSTSNTLAAALSLPYLSFASHNIKPAKLALTPHHLFYLLSRFEDLGIPVGSMNVRLENLHAHASSGNYVSFLGQAHQSKGRKGSDHGSIHSVSSMRSVMSGMSSLWSTFGLSSSGSAAKIERQQAAIVADLKYLYSAFTKIPCLRLAPDRRARLISGYEEFPFDTAVPLLVFKNVSALEISDIDIRQFFGWDRMAEQLRSLTIKRAGVDDPADLLVNIVLDDMDKRRRRSSKAQMSPTMWGSASSTRRSPTMQHAELSKSSSPPGSPCISDNADDEAGRQSSTTVRSSLEDLASENKQGPRSNSPVRPTSSRTGSAHGHIRSTHKIRRSGSASSNSSMSDTLHVSRGSSSNLLAASVLPVSKWRFLKHLSLSDNSLTSISSASLNPLANTLHSLDLSSNLFAQIPDCLANLTALRALNLSNCMIDSLHSLTRNPLPAITALNMRSNRLISLAGVERLYPLERLDLRDNKLTDPTELARLTGIPELREIWVSGNPFTRTHPNYRITIFNLFRKTPGYTEDILIDSSGPGYNERRQLVDRVAERPNVPIVKPVALDHDVVTVESKPQTLVHPARVKGPGTAEGDLSSKTSPYYEGVVTAPRRRKTTKRRIVDLSTTESSPISAKSHTQSPIREHRLSMTGSDSGYGVSPDVARSKAEHETTPTATPKTSQAETASYVLTSSPQTRLAKADTSPLGSPNPTALPEEWSMSGELYRKKIEALRNGAGPGWLSILSDDDWDSPTTPLDRNDFHMSGDAQYPIPADVRTPSPQTVHSGRTLG